MADLMDSKVVLLSETQTAMLTRVPVPVPVVVVAASDGEHVPADVRLSVMGLNLDGRRENLVAARIPARVGGTGLCLLQFQVTELRLVGVERVDRLKTGSTRLALEAPIRSTVEQHSTGASRYKEYNRVQLVYKANA